MVERSADDRFPTPFTARKGRRGPVDRTEAKRTRASHPDLGHSPLALAVSPIAGVERLFNNTNYASSGRLPAPFASCSDRRSPVAKTSALTSGA